MTRIFIIVLVLLSSEMASQKSHPVYSVIAHAHNDYDKANPIHNALAHGFTSLEVDIAYDGQVIKVSHDLANLDQKPEFESGYLKPFLEAEKPASSYVLLVDLKNYVEEGVELLHQILSRYDKHLVSRSRSDENQGTVQILLSGHYPRLDIINNERYEYCFIDGRPSLIDSGISPEIMPWISTSYKFYYRRNRKGRNTKIELSRLEKYVADVQKAGYKVRFWNTPDRKKTWKQLTALNVDIIAVDEVRKFHKVMKNSQKR